MIYDNDYYDLMALAEGYSAEDVDCFGGDVLLEVVSISAMKAYFSKEMKDAKAVVKEADKLAKTDPKAAKKKYDEAIKSYEQIKKDVRDKVKDDNLVLWFFTKGWLDALYAANSGEQHDTISDKLKSTSRDEIIYVINASISNLKKKKAKL